jgi:hypothetical protein
MKTLHIYDGWFGSAQIYAASSKNIDPQRLNYFKAKQLTKA